ncbi:MAG: tRNA (adenosine(37)-N6)-threonylcarbamoyltransferase complex transferase subunit TsaD [Candidatus Nitronauta litoralis]|uniref:tRNA N6-adenosine threonylcarbamoyltransferase n=1 Tax=Candidatus Nitronauta litoralis TaxID=2705533 RepID=A0A7T0G1I1_9BACT|nr:MAG: tRNA (adenosine(37)-N6)-threonylcarbamoyltransferase complex transferase subunit TsaD [Candidatus Nitronauta litoralis]
MLVLGIETSCDETAAAVLRDGHELLSNVIFSQVDIHSKYGGIVPEIAGRCHIESIDLVVQQALQEAGVDLGEIDLIGVTEGPGLVVSLIVGINAAKALGYASNIPVLGINHLEGHLLAIFLQEQVAFPFLALIVSGGHTDLVRADGVGQYKVIGRTRDDAAGESFDKVAKMLGLGYPGGPLIEKLGREGDPSAHAFPRSMLTNGNFDFSFSGIKSAVRRHLETNNFPGNQEISLADIAASFQEAVVDVLIKKLLRAARNEGLERLVLTGGVAANGCLRDRLFSEAEKEGFSAFVPKPVYCTDNAAMIASAAFLRHEAQLQGTPLMELDGKSSLSF